MPHVSKRPWPPKTLQEAEKLIEYFLIDTSSGRRRKMFNEVFTKTERSMLAKRFFMIFLLERKVSSYKIWKLLGVSPSTIARFAVSYEKGRFRQTAGWLRMASQHERILSFIADLALLPLATQHKSFRRLLNH